MTIRGFANSSSVPPLPSFSERDRADSPDSACESTYEPLSALPDVRACRGDVPFVETTPSSATDGGSVRATMTGTKVSGRGAESVSRAQRPSPFCPIGWRHPDTTPCTAGSSPASVSRPGTPPSKRHRTAARLPDASTVRRWARRRLLSLWCWIQAGALGQRFLQTPTIVAWDLDAFCRILPLEARSP